MPGWFEAFLIKLFFAVGEELTAKGLLKIEEWNDIRMKVEKARDYKKVVDKPNNTREERRRAEDDFLS